MSSSYKKITYRCSSTDECSHCFKSSKPHVLLIHNHHTVDIFTVWRDGEQILIGDDNEKLALKDLFDDDVKGENISHKEWLMINPRYRD